MNRADHRLIAVAVVLFAVIGCEKVRPVSREDFAIPVRAEKAVASDFSPAVVLYGLVQPSLTIPLTSPEGGTVDYPARFKGGLRSGELARSGEALAFVYNEASRLDLSRARLELERAESSLRRTRAGFEQGVVEKAQLESDETGARIARATLESIERRARRLTISAPRDGVLVVEEVFAPQSNIGAGVVLAKLAANGKARVEAVAAASELSRLRPGQPVTLQRAEGETRVKGRLIEVGSTVEAGGTIRVIAEAESREGLPSPGEGVEVHVEVQSLESVVTVPEDAIVVSGGVESVFLVDGTERGVSRARSAPVSIGGRAGGRVAILSGVSVGDFVVVRGTDLISDGMLIQVVEDDDTK